MPRVRGVGFHPFMPPLSGAYPWKVEYHIAVLWDLQRMEVKAPVSKALSYTDTTPAISLSPGIRFVLVSREYRVRGLPSRTVLSAGAEPTGIEKTLT